jgi:hypothetical protein
MVAGHGNPILQIVDSREHSGATIRYVIVYGPGEICPTVKLTPRRRLMMDR